MTFGPVTYIDPDLANEEDPIVLEPDDAFLLALSARKVREDPVAAKEAFREAGKANICSNCGKQHRIITTEECIDRKMSEKTLQNRVRGRAKSRGWTVAHAGRGWVGDLETGAGQMVTQMAPGFPDLFFLKKGMPHPAFFAELKRQTGEVDPEQTKWLLLLNACGIPAIIIRPSDLREGRVNAILEGR